MRVRTPAIRSKFQGFDEEEMAEAKILAPEKVWQPSEMTEERIQALVERGLLGPKIKLEWRAAAGEDFPTEDDKETVIFAAHFERGFGIPTGDFFHGMLHYYRIELVHLIPNSIMAVATFIHLCEAYLGIPPHFDLWRYFYQVKRTGKSKVIGSVGFNLRSGLKSKYIDMELPDSLKRWGTEWFYIAKQKPELPKQTDHSPVRITEWDMSQPPESRR